METVGRASTPPPPPGNSSRNVYTRTHKVKTRPANLSGRCSSSTPRDGWNHPGRSEYSHGKARLDVQHPRTGQGSAGNARRFALESEGLLVHRTQLERTKTALDS